MLKVYGYNTEEAFIKKGRTISPSLDFRSFSDHCEPLALETGGSVWNGNLMVCI